MDSIAPKLGPTITEKYTNSSCLLASRASLLRVWADLGNFANAGHCIFASEAMYRRNHKRCS